MSIVNQTGDSNLIDKQSFMYNTGSIQGDFLRAIREEKVFYIPNYDLDRLMPDCPGKKLLLTQEKDNGSLTEWHVVFEKEVVELPHLDMQGNPVQITRPTQQLSEHSIIWPDDASQEDMKSFREKKLGSLPMSLCVSCKRMGKCWSKGIRGGVFTTG